MKSKFIQFELWKDCNNNCPFCFNRGQVVTLSKLKSLSIVKDFINSDRFSECEEFSIIGGEFFDNQLDNDKVNSSFYDLFHILSVIEKIKKVYITSSLIFDISKHLIPFLGKMKELKILDKIYICTSYDTAYRFHSDKDLELWKQNMLWLRDHSISTHVQAILTQDFINKVLSNEFKIKEFCNTYKTSLDYNEPLIGSYTGTYYKSKQEMNKDLPLFFPTKNSFIRFVAKTCIVEKSINPKTFLTMLLRSDELYMIDGDKFVKSSDRKCTTCFDIIEELKKKDKTIKDGIGFIDSDELMLNIAKQVLEMNGDF